MVLKESKLFQISGFAKTVLLAITIVIAGCGGGGGSSSADPPPASGWVAGEYDDWRLTSMRNICENPRNTADTDTQGTVTDENNWIRSYSNDTYLWYSELSDIDPGTVSSAEGILRFNADQWSITNGQCKRPISLQSKY